MELYMKKWLSALSLSTLLLSNGSSATPFDCNVDLFGVIVYSSGSVNVLHSGRGDWTVICNLNNTYKDVGVVTCAMWTSMLLNIKNNGKKVNFYYDNQYGSCDKLPTYGNAPVPVYIGPVGAQ
jgi:hypothetical protein